MKKRALSFLLALVMVLSMLPLSMLSALEVTAEVPENTTVELTVTPSAFHAVKAADAEDYTITADLALKTNKAFTLGSLEFSMTPAEGIGLALDAAAAQIPVSVEAVEGVQKFTWIYTPETTDPATQEVIPSTEKALEADTSYSLGKITLTGKNAFSITNANLLEETIVGVYASTEENGTTYELVPVLEGGYEKGGHGDIDTVWQPLSMADMATFTMDNENVGGHYYLTEDVTLVKNAFTTRTVDSKEVSFTNTTMTICLNGHTLNGGGESRIFRMADGTNITICDCQKSGTICNTTEDGKAYNGINGSLFGLIAGTTTLTLEDVTLNGMGQTKSTADGGALYANVDGATMVLNNCNATDFAGDDGGVIYIVRGTLEINGGSFTNNIANDGGVIHITRPTTGVRDKVHATISNATFTNNSVTAYDGVLFCEFNTDVTVNNCTFKENSTSGHGPSVLHVAEGSEMELNGCTLTDNERTIPAATGVPSGAIQVRGQTSRIYFGGKTVIRNNTDFDGEERNISFNQPLKDNKNAIYANGLTEGTSMTVFTYNDRITPKAFFTREDANELVIATDAQQGWEPTWIYYDQKPGYIITMDDQKSFSFEKHSHEDDAPNTEWELWTDGTKLPTTTGHYVLMTDVTLSAQAAYKQPADVTICLNNHDIRADGAERIFYISGDVDVTVCDCKATGSITDGTYDAGTMYPGVGASNNGGGVASLVASGTATMSFTMEDGIVDGTGVTCVGSGAAFFCANQYSTVYLRGGVVKNCTTSKTASDATGGGGAGYFSSGGDLYASNVLFENNKTTGAAGKGGALLINSQSPTVELTNCIFKDNSTATTGGAIYVNTGNVTITGGKIKNNDATSAGSALYQVAGALEMTGVEVANNVTTHTATIYGPTIYTKGGTLDIKECTFKENTHVKSGTAATNNAYGGALYYNASADVDIQDSVFIGNEATHGGAIAIFNKGTDLTLSGCTFKENTAATQGGAIALINSNTTELTKISAEDCIFEGNSTTTGPGGAIYAQALVTLTDCTLTGNTAKTTGGAVNIVKGASNGKTSKLIATGTTFEDNTGTNGGAVYSGTATVQMTSCFVLNNTFTKSALYITGTSPDNKLTNTEFRGNSQSDGAGGSAVYNESSINLMMDSCTVTNNRGGDGALYPSKTSAITLSGSTVIRDNYAADGERNLWLPTKSGGIEGAGQVNVDGLTEGTDISVYTQATKTAADLMRAVSTPAVWENDWIRYDNNGQYVAYGDDPATPEEENVFYFLQTQTGPHDHGDDGVEWKPISSTDDILKAESGSWYLTEGHYYLTNNITLTKNINLGETLVANSNITICLNGHTIGNSTNASRIFRLSNGNHLTVCDCTAHEDSNGNLVAGRLMASNVQGGAIAMYNYASSTQAAKLTLDSIIIDSAVTSSTATGSAIYMGAMSDAKHFQADITDCVIRNCTTTTNGTIHVSDWNKLNITGGKIVGNKTSNGGAIYATTDATVTISGTELSGNTATASGGAIYATTRTKVTLKDSAVLKDNVATTFGGAAQISSSSELNATDTTFQGNKTLVDNGDSSGLGSAVRTSGSTVKLNKCIFRENEAAGHGAVYINGASSGHEITDTVFENNVAKRNAGGSAIYNESSTSVKLTSCTVTGNRGATGALYPSSSSVMVLSGKMVVQDNYSKAGAECNLHLTNKSNTATVTGVSQILVDGLTDGTSITATSATAKTTAAALMLAVNTPANWNSSWIKYENNSKLVDYVDGTFVFVDEQAKVNGTAYGTLEDAIAAAGSNVVQLVGDITTNVTLPETTTDEQFVQLDLNGKTFTKLGSAGSNTTLHLGCSTMAYTDTDPLTVLDSQLENVTIPSAYKLGNRRYVVTRNDADNGYEIHRVQLAVSAKALRPADMSVGVKVRFSKAMSLEDFTFGMKFVVNDGMNDVVTEKLLNTTLVNGRDLTVILNDFDLANHPEYAEYTIYGTPYIVLAGTEEKVYGSPVELSFKAMVQYADGQYNNLTDAQKSAIDTMCETPAFKGTNYQNWGLQNIAKQ